MTLQVAVVIFLAPVPKLRSWPSVPDRTSRFLLTALNLIASRAFRSSRNSEIAAAFAKKARSMYFKASCKHHTALAVFRPPQTASPFLMDSRIPTKYALEGAWFSPVAMQLSPSLPATMKLAKAAALWWGLDACFLKLQDWSPLSVATSYSASAPLFPALAQTLQPTDHVPSLVSLVLSQLPWLG